MIQIKGSMNIYKRFISESYLAVQDVRDSEMVYMIRTVGKPVIEIQLKTNNADNFIV